MLDHPYTDLTAGQWLRGNLHTHTNRSDGRRPPQDVLDDYAARGYGYVMISDHDLFTSASDYQQWDARGMILIPGNEITSNGPHLLHVDADRFIAPSAQRQQVINEVTGETGGAGQGFIIVNHPNWQGKFDHCTIAQMREWVGYVGMEIYNGTIGRLDGSPYATNKWDMLLSEGRRIWGFANDDSHLPKDDVELGWNVTYVTQRSVAGVVAALRAGRFYCSTGVRISDISVSGRHITIRTDNARRIVALKNIGQRFAVADGNTIEVDYPEEAKYVRFECWGDGEQFAWTQPFWKTP
ncbi:MAG: CehA/McbA family metallohydrolase [Phycisphaeraceae bacterium]